jgi:enamine deaminase RidA (YjgF/YER057c/UK114 family)
MIEDQFVSERLAQRGLSLPVSCKPRADFELYTWQGSTLYLAGQICERDGAVVCSGKVGRDVDLTTAQRAAEICVLNLLFVLRQALDGSFSRVARCLRLGGFVNCIPEYPDAPLVVNAASQLLAHVFGDAGRHARTTIGVASLPANASVEIDAIFQARDI